MPTKASGRSHGRGRRSRSPSPRERRRSRSRSRSEERTNERLRRERDEALSKLEVALSQLRDEAKDCDNARKERDDARKERDDALSQLRLAQRSHTDDVRIQRPYLEQRVTEAANKLQPQWEWADTGESEWEAYSQHLADQLETALATGHTASLVWRPPGASRGSVYEVDTRKVESDSVGSDLLFEKLNVRTETRRAVRRALVPIESNEDAVSVERPPPIFLESYPSCWQGSSDIERVELPPTGPVGARLLEFMLSSMVQQSAAAMQGLEIRRIERVENHSLWENYQRYRHNVVKRMEVLDPEHRPQALSSRHAVMQIMDAPATDPPSSSMHCSCDSVLSTHCNCGSVLPEELHSRVLCETTSEMWLWHGTKPSLVDTVCSFGLDPRKSNLHGLYGAGSYFADASSKSHQYSKHTDADGCRCMLLCRVTMGNPYMTDKNHQNERVPPDNPNQPGQPHDSIFAETGVAPGAKGNGSGGQVHNEYVVFHPDASYPEYIIYYSVAARGIQESGPVSGMPREVQTFLARVGLEAWATYFVKHLPSHVQSVQRAKRITASDLHKMGTMAHMRLDQKTIDQVLDALKKP